MSRFFRPLVASATLVSLCALAAPQAGARVRTVPPLQTLVLPGDSPDDIGIYKVAIDGDSIIVVANVTSDGARNRDALLYRRGSDGQWTLSRILTQSTADDRPIPATVAMNNDIAVIKLGDVATIWEKSGGEWVQSQSAAPITAPGGFDISLDRILAGADGCQADALIYQKNASGVWDINGRIPPDAGVCASNARDVELNYDYALIRAPGNPGTLVRSYLRNGAALQWTGAGSFSLTGQAAQQFGPVTLKNATAVAPGSAYFHRSGSSWSFAGQLQPVDYGYGSGNSWQVLYRDNLLFAVEGWTGYRSTVNPYVYRETAAGGFEHLAILGGEAGGLISQDFDISGDTVVVYSEQTFFGFADKALVVFKLPTPIAPPKSIVNNFDAGNVSGFTQTSGSQFALAGNAANRVYRQSSISAAATAILTGSDWPYFEAIEADITPTAFGTATGWAGLAVRYVDANNYYFVTLRNDDIVELRRKVNGVITTLAQANRPVSSNHLVHARLSIDGNRLGVTLSNGGGLSVQDSSLSHGRAALLTDHTRADFDNLYVTPTARLTLDDAEGWQFGRNPTALSGSWQMTTQPEFGFHQSDTSGTALAVSGGPTDDQTVETDVTLDSFASSNPASWIGVVARYVDPQNYYYVSLRSSNRLQIRKIVGGQTFVLKDAPFTATPGTQYHVIFSALGNELTASVNGVVLARAADPDNSLPVGRFGFSTYRATATYATVSVAQP